MGVATPTPVDTPNTTPSFYGWGRPSAAKAPECGPAQVVSASICLPIPWHRQCRVWEVRDGSEIKAGATPNEWKAVGESTPENALRELRQGWLADVSRHRARSQLKYVR